MLTACMFTVLHAAASVTAGEAVTLGSMHKSMPRFSPIFNEHIVTLETLIFLIYVVPLWKFREAQDAEQSIFCKTASLIFQNKVSREANGLQLARVNNREPRICLTNIRDKNNLKKYK